MIERNDFETNSASASIYLACHALADGTSFGQLCRGRSIELLIQFVKPMAASLPPGNCNIIASLR
jgi:hypothetical protein